MFQFWNQIIGPLLDILSPKEVLQVGGGTGRTATKLAQYARTAHAKLTVIDYFPLFDLAAFRHTWTDVLTFHSAQSIHALPLCAPPDFVLVDGDHNWFTVFHELKAVEALAAVSGAFPVILLHNTAWPYARRDGYILPGLIPEEHRQPYTEGGVVPETQQVIVQGGINERMFHAVQSGGLKNGVLTALEDFLQQTQHKFSVTPIDGFHGLTIIVPEHLLATNASLKEFLHSLSMTPALKQHVDALEQERIQELLTAKDFRLTVQVSRSEQEIYRLAMEELSEKNFKKDLEIARREKTLSWRLTVPLRHAGKFLRVVGKGGSWCGCVKSVWSALGEPFPHAIRWVRYQLLGTLFPVTNGHITAQIKVATETQDAYGGAVPVSVIVTARNNAEFLRECLESILAQSVQPMEIIYCDDGSDDDSLAIASLLPRIHVLPLTHRGVIAARNAAVAESSGDLLLHIDGDDAIPPDYLAELLKALASAPDAAFAYGSSDMFGLQDGFFFHPWDIRRLWTKNFINTSSLVRRSAFIAAGGWRDTTSTLWDWDLWLRVSRIGRGVPSKAVLKYRRHEASWSQIRRKFGPDDTGLLFGRVRRAAARVSVCAILSGRLPDLLEPWMDALAGSIRASASAVEAPELVVLDNSKDGMADEVHHALKKHAGVFRSVLIVPYPVRFSFTNEMERRHMVSKFLALAYNRILQMADGEIVWFIEDDIIVPECAYEILLKDLTDGEIPPAAVSGLYRARHMDQLVAHRIVNGVVTPVKDQHLTPLEIDLGGTGCMMMLRPFVTHPFTSHWRGRAPAHDWAWCDEIRKEDYRIILDPRVRCRHHQTLAEYV